MASKRKFTNGNGRKTKILRRNGNGRTNGRVFSRPNVRVMAVPTELKFHDIDVDDATISATGEILNSGTVNIIAQGTTESQRIGRKCTIKSINWRFDIVRNENAGNWDSDVVRVLMYLDKQCNGATATVAGILESTDYQSFNNLSNKGRFRTLMDRKYVFIPTAAAGDGTTDLFNDFLIYDEFFKQVNITLEYDNSATTGVLTSIRSNNIGVLVISKQGTATTFNSKLRLRFADG